MKQIDQQVVHGALDYGELEQLGWSPAEILDFSVNTNPYGPSPLVRPALAHAAIDRYPDRECLELRRALLACELYDHPLTLDAILCGNGTTELIWAIARTLLPPGSKAAILGPTFGEYAAASHASGAQVVEYRAVEACREETCSHKRELKNSLQYMQGTEGKASSPLQHGTVPVDPPNRSGELASPVCLAHIDPSVRAYGACPLPFHPDLAELLAWLQTEQPTVLWLCNPNNPTGIWLDQQAMSQIADACAYIGTALIVDEAYWHFLMPREAFSAIALLDRQGINSIGANLGDRGMQGTEGEASSPLQHGTVPVDPPKRSGELASPVCPTRTVPVKFAPMGANPSPTPAPLIVLRSLTKTYALAGLRLGYAIAARSVIAQIQQQLPSWNVNSFAQAAGIASLTDRAHCTSTLAELAAQRHNFFQALSMLNVPVMKSRTHFCLIDVGDAHRVRQQLLNKRLLVRDCTSFGLPTYIRVATRQQHDWQQLLSALQEVVICH